MQYSYDIKMAKTLIIFSGQCQKVIFMKTVTRVILYQHASFCYFMVYLLHHAKICFFLRCVIIYFSLKWTHSPITTRYWLNELVHFFIVISIHIHVQVITGWSLCPLILIIQVDDPIVKKFIGWNNVCMMESYPSKGVSYMCLIFYAFQHILACACNNSL
jgi:hypothetical protein